MLVIVEKLTLPRCLMQLVIQKLVMRYSSNLTSNTVMLQINWGYFLVIHGASFLHRLVVAICHTFALVICE